MSPAVAPGTNASRPDRTANARSWLARDVAIDIDVRYILIVSLQPPSSQLYEIQGAWDLWQGSSTEIARLASRADSWLRAYFGLVPEYRIGTSHSVATSVWAGGVDTSAELRDEINARRALVRQIVCMSWATPNGVACISQGLVLPREWRVGGALGCRPGCGGAAAIVASMSRVAHLPEGPDHSL
jgi:hypothetical protein